MAEHWIWTAARHVNSLALTGEGDVDSFAQIIAKACPLKEGVEYRSVPRCDTCKHWGPFTDEVGRKECREPTVSPTQMDELMTMPDFGCVQWEEK